MNRPLLLRSGMRSKILLMTIVPVVSISIILTWYYITVRRADLAENLQQFGETTALYLATASELAMFADDMQSLEYIARGPSQSVHGVVFYLVTGEPLLDFGELGELDLELLLDSPAWQPNWYTDGGYWYFRSSIELAAEPITDYSDFSRSVSEQLGWVVVVLSSDELNKTHRRNLFVGTLISTLVTLLVSIVAWLFSQQIYRPVRELTNIVERMDAGDLSVHATVAGEREIQILARVINRMASSLRETNINLQLEVSETTQGLRAALTDLEYRNNDLLSTRDELENAIGAKDQFLARMSHELRTPLTTIIGFSRRLDHTSLSTEQAEYCHAIHHSSVLLLSVINDILDFSRMQYSGVVLEDFEFILVDELEDIVSMHAHQAYEKSIELILLLDSDVPQRFRGDPVRLKQIVNNLLANAVKFTDEGEVVMRVARSSHESEESDIGILLPEIEGGVEQSGSLTLDISVRDSGIGIADEDIAKLFKPFGQAETSINRRFGGSGLGLVICQQLVELMGGEIQITSESGKGTTVSFTVELQVLAMASEDGLIPGRMDSVAIVDSNNWSRRALRSQVTYWTRQVFAVAEVGELIELISARQLYFSVVLISLSPGAKGGALLLESLSTIRIHYSGPILVLACLEDASLSIPDEVLHGYAPVWSLAKPVRRKNLLDWLDAVDQDDMRLLERSEESTEFSGETSTHGSLKGVNVLIAEDNRFNQNLLKTLLEIEGALVTLADNGVEAIERFQQSDCTLVLMDAHMPLVDGIEATRKILSIAAQTDRDITVVGLTADTTDNESEGLRQAGAKEVLYKPIDEDALVEILCRYSGSVYRSRKSGSILSAETSKSALKRELIKEASNLRRALETGQISDSREVFHQLLGLSGLYGMVELRQRVIELRQSLILQQDTLAREQLSAVEALINRITD